MKKCPICKFDGVKDAARCPKCQSTLTTWINLDQYGEQAYKTALFELSEARPERAAELLFQAVVLSPDNHSYLSAYGRVLGQLGRYGEAALVLEEAWNNGAPSSIKAAIDKAKELTPETQAVTPSEGGSFMGGPAPTDSETVEPELVDAEPVESQENSGAPEHQETSPTIERTRSEAIPSYISPELTQETPQQTPQEETQEEATQEPPQEG